MKDFLREFWFCFKRLWVNPWWYFIVAIGFLGNAPLIRTIVTTALLAVIFPVLGVFYHRYLCNCCRKENEQ